LSIPCRGDLWGYEGEIGGNPMGDGVRIEDWEFRI
jgi:hypothetical protein